MSASLHWFGILWGLQEVRHTAKSSTLCHPLFCDLVFAVEILEEYQMGWFCSLVIVLSADTFCGQCLFPGLFFPCISCSGVESGAGELQLFVIGRQWEACLCCMCVGWWLQVKSNSKVTRWQLCHISFWHALHDQHYSSLLFQSWPALYWQADHFLSKPVTSLPA